MKKLVLTAIALTTAVSVFAQGQVVFQNRVAGTIITHVYSGGTSQVSGNGTADLPAGTQNWTGYTALEGSQYLAALLAAPGPGGSPETGTIVWGSPTTSFRTTAAGAGWVNTVTSSVGNVAAGGTATFEMFAWDNTSGLYATPDAGWTAWKAGTIAGGVSPKFDVANLGGGIITPPNLVGLQSFNIYSAVPEPSALALAGLGAAALLIFRRRK